MSLRDIIEILKKEDPTKVVKHGFDSPHSYRGYYEDLAFEPAENVTVASMLELAEGCIGRVFEGYKGGEYTMGEHSTVWLSQYGDNSQETLSPRLLGYMLAE